MILKQHNPCYDHKESDTKTDLLIFESGMINPAKHYL
jgi:hypothetical protein